MKAEAAGIHMINANRIVVPIVGVAKRMPLARAVISMLQVKPRHRVRNQAIPRQLTED
jgi:hypothetical protein